MPLHNTFCTVQEALNELQKGKFIIVLDDEHRENEGDLIIPAENATPENINFMIKKGGGLICVPLSKDIANKLELDLMVKDIDNMECTKCKFTLPVDLKEGITTGISAQDRSKTIKALSSPASKPNDFNKPGHVFPLIAEDEGVLKRPGHTEAAIELMKLGDFIKAASICEILDDEGKSASLVTLQSFAEKHDLKILDISTLIEFVKKLN